MVEKLNILVTGATGFIGRPLVEELSSSGHSIRCLVRNRTEAEKLLSDLRNIELVEGDLTNPETLRGIGEGIDTVYHLAAQGHVASASKDAYNTFYKINVGGTENLLNSLATNKNIKKVIMFSSTAAMGLISDMVVEETTPCNPVTPYQKSKYQSEQKARETAEKLDIPLLILRPCMVYGKHGFGEFHKFVQLVKKNFMPMILQKTMLTPIVHVKDVVQASVKALEKGKPGETYLICGEESYPFNMLLKLIFKALNKKLPLIPVPYKAVYFAAYIFETAAKLTKTTPLVTRQNIRSTVADRRFSIDKARNELGYVPQVRPEDGIGEVVGWYRSNRFCS